MSKIQWTDETWNPTVGCTRVSPGCENCYAERVAHRGMTEAHRGLTRQTARGPVWNGTVRLLPERLEQPLRWRKPRRVFVDSMSDLFHPDVPDGFIDRVFGVMAFSPKHTFQVLTKRPERMRDWFARTVSGCSREQLVFDEYESLWRNMGGSEMHVSRGWSGWPLPGVWLGTSVEDQERADERIPPLLQTPAAVRFLSVEPLLGPVDLRCLEWLREDGSDYFDALSSQRHPLDDAGLNGSALDWIIVGGESGTGACPCRVEWIRDVLRQCREAGVPAFCDE